MLDSTRLQRGRAELPGEAPTAAAGGARRYVLEQRIGSGAMGVVYRAQDRVLGRTVAIKTIREELISRGPLYEAYRTRFHREACICGSLSHPNIVKLYDAGDTDEEAPFLAMEYVQGASLAGLLRAGRRLTLDQAMWLLAQLASAIDYAHGQDVIHRDIKPSNILVGEGEEAKITDFGVAKLLGAEFTRSQTRFGTPGYMSPEQVLGTALTGTTDIFSLGVVAFELFSGFTPFPGSDPHSVLYRIVHTEPVFPPDLKSLGLVPSKWRDVFQKALAKDPEQRHATASELVSDFVEIFPGSWLGDLIADQGSRSAPGFSGAPSQETTTLGPAEPVRFPENDTSE
jgi:serine/threonine-protein kinase